MRSHPLGAMLCGSLLGVATAWAAPGDYDSSFGTKGIVRAPFETRAFGQALGQQPDGHILAAGVVHPAQGGYEQVALIRLHPNGDVDTSFGAGGAARTTVGSSTPEVRSILVEDDGKLVVVGFLSSVSDDSIFLVRHDVQGNLDSTFGNGGVSVTTPPGAQGATNAVLQPDGKVVVATSAAGDVLVLRYGTEGALDPNFGTGGIATVNFGFSDTAAALVLEPGGGVVLLGAAVDPGNASYIALARLDDAGALDPTFGNAGTILHDIGSAAPPGSLVRSGDGKLLVSAGGYVGNPGQFTGAYLLRLEANGALDPTFGVGGVLADASEYVILALRQAPDDKLVGVSTTGYELVVQRFAADGSLDPTFGDGGEIETQVGVGTGYPSDVLVEPDGKIDVTGVEYSACEPMNCDTTYDIAYRFFVRRFQGGTVPCAADGDCGPCESCGAAGACVFGPRVACAHAQLGGAKLAIDYDPFSDDLDGYRIRLKWRGATPLGFDPLTTDDVGMCLYLEGKRALRAIAPAGGLCAGSPCWQERGTSFSYRDRDGSPDGIEKLKLRTGATNLDASGSNLATSMHGIVSPASPEVLSQSSILAQVHGGNGQCLQATLSNIQQRFKAIGPGALAIVGLRAVGD